MEETIDATREHKNANTPDPLGGKAPGVNWDMDLM
jgi:hypothetical protein